MLQEIGLEEKGRRFNDALDSLQRTIEAGRGVQMRRWPRSVLQGTVGGLGPHHDALNQQEKLRAPLRNGV